MATTPPGAWIDDDGTRDTASQDSPVKILCAGIFSLPNFVAQALTPVHTFAHNWWAGTRQVLCESIVQDTNSSLLPRSQHQYRELHPPPRTRRLSHSAYNSGHDASSPGPTSQYEAVPVKFQRHDAPFEEQLLTDFSKFRLTPITLVKGSDLVHDAELRISNKGRERYEKRARDLAERLRLEKEAEEARRKAEEAAREAERLKKAGGRRPLNTPFILDYATYHEIANALVGKRPDDTITTALNGTELKTKDCATLWGKTNWLNDEIVNTQLGWICFEANKRLLATESIPAVAAMPSFFYNTLASKGYQGVARWAKRQKIGGPSLLKAQTVLVPINNASHWTLLVLSPRLRKIEYFDSLGGLPPRFFANIRVWLAGELGKAYKADEWKEEVPNRVQQTNGYDCGVFLLTNAELCSFGIEPVSYQGRDMPAQRLRIACILMDRGFGKHAEYLGV